MLRWLQGALRGPLLATARSSPKDERKEDISYRGILLSLDRVPFNGCHYMLLAIAVGLNYKPIHSTVILFPIHPLLFTCVLAGAISAVYQPGGIADQKPDWSRLP